MKSILINKIHKNSMMSPPIPLSQDFQRLLTWRDDFILSLYMPARAGSAHAAENGAAFRQLISRASVMLGRGGWTESEILSFLTPLTREFDENFWKRHTDAGFALFCGKRGAVREFWTLAEAPPRTVVLNRHAHVKPLLKCWFQDVPYYLLQLGSENLRLFLGNAVVLEEFDDPDIRNCYGLPVGELSMAADSPPASAPASAPAPAVAGGRYNDFCRTVMKPLVKRFESDQYPLIVCGEKDAVDLFLEFNTYDRLLGCFEEPDPERLSTEELRARAVETIRDWQWRTTLRTLGEFSNANTGNRLVDDLETSLERALDGHVRKLFVACDREVWGEFDPATGAVVRKNFPGLGREDLLDTCSRLVLLNGGEVFPVNAKTLKSHTGAERLSSLVFRRAVS